MARFGSSSLTSSAKEPSRQLPQLCTVLQTLLDNCSAKAQILYELKVSTMFDVQLYFHETTLMSTEFEREKLNILWITENSTLKDMAVQLMEKEWEALTKCSSLGARPVVTELYLWSNPAVI